MQKKPEIQRWLESARVLEESIRCDLESVAAMRAAAAKTTTTLSLTGGCSVTSDRFLEDSILNIVTEEEKIARKTARLKTLEQEMLQLFSALEKPEHRTLLLKRYCYGKPFSDIADEMNISRAQVYRLHSAALAVAAERVKIETG